MASDLTMTVTLTVSEEEDAVPHVWGNEDRSNQPTQPRRLSHMASDLNAAYSANMQGSGAGGCLAALMTLLCTRRGLSSTDISAVVFDPPSCIGEVADSEWCGPQGCNLQVGCGRDSASLSLP